MDNAESQFLKLDLSYIEQQMVGNDFESNWLECKEKQRADHGGLDQGDRSNFAKALAGFANTSGGVLIFGLEARKDGDEIDQIVGLKPIRELRRFESALREQESRVVERLVVGVQYKRLNTAPDEGLIAIYVPASDCPPHRSQIDSKFYLRAGGTFSSMPISLIEDLFARRQRPALQFIVREASHQELIVALANHGRASARNPYVIFRIPQGVTQSGYELNGNTRLESWIQVYEYKGQKGTYFSFQAGSALVVHPESEVPLLKLRYSTPPHGSARQETDGLDFEYQVYAENMVPSEGIAKVSRTI